MRGTERHMTDVSGKRDRGALVQPERISIAGRAGKTAPGAGENLVLASRVRELEREIEELRRLVNRQALVLGILEKRGTL